MTLYVMDLWMPDAGVWGGIPVSQGRRSRLLKEADIEIKNIIVELPNYDSLQKFVDLGVPEATMLSLFHHFTDHCHLLPQLDSEKVILDDPLIDLTTQEKDENFSRFTTKDKQGTVSYRKNKSGKLIDKTVMHNAYYIMRETYTDCKFMTEYAVPMTINGVYQGIIQRRCFHNRDGSIAFEQHLNQEKEYFLYQGQEYSFLEFMGLFFEQLQLTKEDTVLLDRPNNIQVQAVFTYVQNATIAVFLHSDHLYREKSLPNHPRPSYDYDIYYQYASRIDYWIVSTQSQKNELEKFLTFYGGGNIIQIPVAGIAQNTYTQNPRYPYSIMAASRFEKRKRIDLLIKSVVEAHKHLPKLELDLYGDGLSHEVTSVKELITQLGAQDYIHLKGYQKLDHIFQQYSLFASVSLWETFGLTYLEAISSGTSLLGLDVPYSSRDFIKHGENGYLIPFEDKSERQVIEKLSQAIIQHFTIEDMEQFSKKSYEIATNYQNEQIKKLWTSFLNTQN